MVINSEADQNFMIIIAVPLLSVFLTAIIHDLFFENKWLSGPIKLYKKSNEKLTMYTIKKYEGKYGSPSKPIESLTSFDNFESAIEFIKLLPIIDKPGFINFYAIDHDGKTILTFLGKEICPHCGK